MLKIRDNVDLKELEKFGFEKNSLGDYVKNVKRQIVVYSHTRGIIDYKYDSSTYTGFAYSNEYRKNTRHYIQDLIKADLVEEVEQ